MADLISLLSDNFVIIVIGIAMFLMLAISSGFGYFLGRQRAKKEDEKDASVIPSKVVRLVSNITNSLNASLNYRRVIEIALDLSASTIGKTTPLSAQMISAALLFDRDHLYVYSARRFTRADHRVTFPVKKGMLKHVMQEGRGGIIKNPASDPELGQISAMQECSALYCVPLRGGLEVFGLLIFGHPNEDYFTAENREIIDIIASQATVAIQNATLFQELENEKNRIAETQEKTRKQLARDLHDGPTQSVAAIAMQANYTRRLVDKDKVEAKKELKKIEELARRTTKEIRHMLFTLRPLVLESQGLEAGLISMAEKIYETFEQQVIVDVDSEVIDRLDGNKQATIFFIVEEAVNNARKHSLAEKIHVRLKSIRKDFGQLEIQDDGTGFDVVSVKSSYGKRGSLGLINLQERTELINGVLDIKSIPGEGTLIRVLIPLTEEAVEKLRHT